MGQQQAAGAGRLLRAAAGRPVPEPPRRLIGQRAAAGADGGGANMGEESLLKVFLI